MHLIDNVFREGKSQTEVVTAMIVKARGPFLRIKKK